MMNENYNLYSMDADSCPDTDAIIAQGMCTGCMYYKGFEMYNGQRCIRCAYYQLQGTSEANS